MKGEPVLSRSAAIITELRRFSRPSVRGIPMGSCDPVRITGFLSPSIIKLNADAVNAIVSVPWRSTKPSYFLWWVLMMVAILRQCDGLTFDESIGGLNETASIVMPDRLSSGTWDVIWLKSIGTREPVHGSCTLPMVPPV